MAASHKAAAKDVREVLYDAKEHTTLVESILAESHLKPHNIFRHADVKGKWIVDIGCGDAAMSREAIRRGAKYALGIDGKREMVKEAIECNQPFNIKVPKIETRQAFIEDIHGERIFDIAILSYMLNNARSYDQLSRQCEATASFLKKGGIAIVYNSNPFDTLGGDFTKYGFRKTLTGTKEGDVIHYDYRPAITEDILNYYLTPTMHEQAFHDAGFSEFSWKPLELYPKADRVFWNDYFDRQHLPVIGMVAKK